MESIRPELELTGWSRASKGTGEAAYDVIAFKSVKNIGRGVALHLNITAFYEVADVPAAMLGRIRRPILASNDEIQVTDFDGQIFVYWNRIETKDGSKQMVIPIRLFCRDCRGNLYETRYRLLAVELSSSLQGVGDEIAPGVAVIDRVTGMRSRWSLKLLQRLSSVPGVGRFFARYR